MFETSTGKCICDIRRVMDRYIVYEDLWSLFVYTDLHVHIFT